MNNQELPKLFKSYQEVEVRENFDPNCGITLENFKSLLGEYHFSEEYKCQVRKSDGNCGHYHQHGWLGLTKDGKEGLIGGHCATKYFNADKNFAIEKNRIRKEISISNSLDTLSKILSNRGEFEKSIEAEIVRLRSLRDSIKSIESKLVPSVIKALSDMTKTGNRTVYIQVQYIEIDDKGKKIIDWVDQPIGNISGTSIWLYSNLGSIFSALKGIKITLDEIVLVRESGERKLKKWANVLSSLPGHSANIDELQNEYNLFTDNSNLSLLMFLVTDQKEQTHLAKLVLECSGNDSPSSNDARKFVRQLEEQIKSNNGNRNFRVPR